MASQTEQMDSELDPVLDWYIRHRVIGYTMETVENMVVTVDTVVTRTMETGY